MTKLVDLSHPWGADIPPFPGQEPPKIVPFHQIGVSGNQTYMQRVETTMHIGTHFDAPSHIVPNGSDLASIPLETLFGEGVIVDISHEVGEWDIIRPGDLTKRMKIRPGDIVVIHTGWHDHFVYGKAPDPEKYLFNQPGGAIELAQWIVDMRLKWIGVDCGSPDHPMNNGVILKKRPDLVEAFERKTGRPVEETFPPKNRFCMHKIPFAQGITHAENVGGDIDAVLNCRCNIGVFPWKWIGGDGCISRIVAFLED
jgi:kynurenine formamidase